jgi:hypothetical protein
VRTKRIALWISEEMSMAKLALAANFSEEIKNVDTFFPNAANERFPFHWQTTVSAEEALLPLATRRTGVAAEGSFGRK